MGRTSRVLQMTLQTKAASAAFLLLISSSVLAAQPAEKNSACPALWQKTFPRLQDDKPQDLCQYRGKVALVVNTASYCGFTSQYEGLEKVYARYQAQGLVVLGFPSNDFGQQEPGNSKQIADFCFNTYGVKFPMFAKSSVAPGAGRSVNPLFVALAQRSGQGDEACGVHAAEGFGGGSRNVSAAGCNAMQQVQ